MRALPLLAAFALAACERGPPAPEQVPQAQIAEDWPSIPEDAVFGEVSAVDVDSHGHVFVLHRAGRVWDEPFPAEPIPHPTVFMFARNGKLLDHWGEDTFIMPHGLSIGPQDKVWITDVGREQVFRFSHSGEEELTLGERGVAGSDAAHFGRPTDVAFDGGRVLVSDGYDNARVAVFDRSGEFIEQFGAPGTGEGEFDTPHAIAVDDEHIYVADRENARVQVFDKQGRFLGLRGQEGTGHPYSVAALGGGWLLVLEGRDLAGRTGATLRVYRPGGKLDRSLDAGLPGDNASLGHDVAIGPGGAYVADVYGDRVIRVDLSEGVEQ